MEDFICLKCNYRFQGNTKGECPYCGSESIEKEKSAEELLKSL